VKLFIQTCLTITLLLVFVGSANAGSAGICDACANPNQFLNSVCNINTNQIICQNNQNAEGSLNEGSCCGQGGVAPMTACSCNGSTPTPEPIVIIPTMGQWGMIIATILLGFFAIIRLRRIKDSELE